MTGLDELYRKHADDAVRLAYLLTGQRETAEDLAQDAFIRVARRLVQLRNPDAFGSYLRQTIVNLANSHFRRRRIERVFLSKQEGLAERHAEQGDPQGPLILRATLKARLLRLPVRQRTAIVLRFSEDLSDGQIAEILHTSPGNARQLIYRGMTSLREHLEVQPHGN